MKVNLAERLDWRSLEKWAESAEPGKSVQSTFVRGEILSRCFPNMSSDAPPDGREVDSAQPFSAFLSDDNVRIFAPETCVVGAALCTGAAAFLFWMGLLSAQ